MSKVIEVPTEKVKKHKQKEEPGMVKTCVLKLHNPSVRKRAILGKTFKSYHLLTSAILEKLKQDEEDFKQAKVKANDAYSYCKKYVPTLKSVVLPSNLKISACRDSVRMMLGYIASGVETKQPPNVPSLQQQYYDSAYIEAIEGFISCTQLQEEGELRDKVSSTAKDIKYLPILIYSVNDRSNPGVTIGYNPDKNKYYAIIFVGNVVKGIKAPKLVLTAEHNLFNIKDNSPIIYPTGTQSGIIVPLDFGFFQLEKYIKKGVPKEAHLVYRKDVDEYFLHLAFKFIPEKIKTETLMGIDRGINNIAAYAVVKPDSYESLVRGYIEGKTVTAFFDREDLYRKQLQQSGRPYTGNRKRNFANTIIHLTTNEIVKNAVKYKSQVFVEDLVSLADRSKIKVRFKGNKNSRLKVLFNSTFYQKFLRTLTYKLEYKGLPKPKVVHPAWTSTTCPKCGKIDKLNRTSQETFNCIQCGFTDKADLNAGVVIAMKGQWHWLPKDQKISRYGGSTYEDFITRSFA